MRSLARNARLWRPVWWTLLGLLAFFVAAPVWGVDDVIRVEEDWELVVATPEPLSNSPQVTCILSPLADLSGPYAVLELNDQTYPDYAPGGLQLQLWNAGDSIPTRRSVNTNVLSQNEETITWTTTMELKSGMLTIQISGSSTTWGQFGGEEELKISVPCGLANLNGYSPDVSVNRSFIGFASNRVRSLTLTQVRLITSTQQQLQDTTSRVVYPQP
jgi:hypothetical protein